MPNFKSVVINMVFDVLIVGSPNIGNENDVGENHSWSQYLDGTYEKRTVILN